MTTLRDLSSDMLQALENAFDPDTGELTQSFESLRSTFKDKATSIALYILDVQGDILKLQGEIERLSKITRRKQNKIASLKEYLSFYMKETGCSEISANLLSIKLQIERDESVEVDAGFEFPEHLCHAPKPGLPNKAKIKAALEAGEYIEGARIVKKDRLTIQ